MSEPMPIEVAVPDGDYDISQDFDWEDYDRNDPD